jgi:nitroreductase
MQPWRFIVIQKQELLKKISDEAKRCGLERIAKYPESPFCRFKNTFTNPDYCIFYNAPALILVVGENSYPFFHQDCACATTYLMFAATARGLGTCWIGHAHLIEDKSLRKEIGLPDNCEIAAAVIIGYPKVIPQKAARSELIILKSIE